MWIELNQKSIWKNSWNTESLAEAVKSLLADVSATETKTVRGRRQWKVEKMPPQPNEWGLDFREVGGD